eukprot:CAMPEP_0174717580 /NCGR_PEP_ID=MMETSP1094-20130205/26612_1 /TAXON_ID=156173 /ORGANISM="Chrysochromulina brevifilum, Strain UTEX LB 985" /LENGTH=44 /DNA_ID= /DNA_START= /DNA_END= /DNA_ORIENTATION=
MTKEPGPSSATIKVRCHHGGERVAHTGLRIRNAARAVSVWHKHT